MLIMVCYFKKICGINQAEDWVTWPDHICRHTSALASFREWSVVSAWLRIRAQPRNPCQPCNSASASTWKWWIWACDVTPTSRIISTQFQQPSKPLQVIQQKLCTNGTMLISYSPSRTSGHYLWATYQLCPLGMAVFQRMGGSSGWLDLYSVQIRYFSNHAVKQTGGN